ncbi:MAG: mechanosensitive ion channel [Clostridia bacterium]|nr:mechanosensitive ion channel [Clostridia bacterium]
MEVLTNVSTIEESIEALQQDGAWEKIKEELMAFLPKLGFMALIVVFGILFTYLLNKMVKMALSRTRIDPSLGNFFRLLIRIACYVLIVIMALSELGIATTGLIAFFSAGLGAVALALKDSLSDIASGIILLFSRPFVTGDVIKFDDCMGTVLKIDIVHTNILTYDDTNVIIPNSRITSSEVINYTDHPESRITVIIPIAYDADIDRVKQVLMDTMLANDDILKDDTHTPKVQLERYSDSALEFSARCWTNFKTYWSVYYALTEDIKKNLDKHRIPIPFNQLDLHIVNDAAGDLQIKKNK